MKTGTPSSQSIVCKTSGLELRMSGDSSINAIAGGEKGVALLDLPGGFEVAEYRGAEKGAQVLEPVSLSTNGGPTFSYDEEKLTLSVDIEEAEGYLKFHGKLKDTSGEDRALIVSFTLPVNAWGWTWWDDLDRTRVITHGVQYANYSFLGERRDIPISQIPFSTISHHPGGSALALAVPLHHPRIFRFNYSTDKGYRVEFDLGLSPATEKFPGEADFTFILYPCDPVWGLRSAAEKYYSFFPELYTKRVPREGVGSSEICREFMPPAADLEKYGIAFVWTGNHPIEQDPEFMRYLRENGVLSLKHREPWARWHLVYPFKDHPWYDQFPGRRRDLSTIPVQPSVEEELEMLREEAKAPEEVRDGNDQIPGPVCEVAQATLNCLVYDEHDRPRITLWHLWSAGGWHSQIPLNVDPDIPELNRATMARRYQFQNMEYWGDPDANVANMISWDSMTDWTGFHLEDFRRENFKYADEPLSFHYGTGRPMILCGFHDFEMAQQWCREVRAKGGYIKSNTEPQAMLFAGQFLDLAGWERSPDQKDETDMLLVRCLMDQKPWFFYRRGTEDGLRKMLTYGVYPSSAPLLPSGESTPSEQAEQWEMQRLYLKYARLSIRIAAAGWQPVTHARAVPSRPEDDYRHGTRMKLVEIGGRTYFQSEDDTYEAPNGEFSTERFGDGSKDLYFTLRSHCRYDGAIMLIDLRSLDVSRKALNPVELVEGRDLVWDVCDDMMRIIVPITSSETLVLSLMDQKER